MVSKYRPAKSHLFFFFLTFFFYTFLLRHSWYWPGNDPFFVRPNVTRSSLSLQHGVKPDRSSEAVVIYQPAADKARTSQDGLFSSCSPGPLSALSRYLSPRVLNGASNVEPLVFLCHRLISCSQLKHSHYV